MLELILELQFNKKLSSCIANMPSTYRLLFKEEITCSFPADTPDPFAKVVFGYAGQRREHI